MFMHRRPSVPTPVVLPALVVALSMLAAPAAQAQANPRSFEASPDIYKVIAKDARSLVIEVTWKPGQRDVLHGHPPAAVYYLTDCHMRIQLPDGSTRESWPKAGAANVNPAIAGHVLENIGSQECRMVMFEPA